MPYTAFYRIPLQGRSWEARQIRVHYGNTEVIAVTLGFEAAGVFSVGTSYRNRPEGREAQRLSLQQRLQGAYEHEHRGNWRSFARAFKQLANQCNSLAELAALLSAQANTTNEAFA